MSDVWGRTPSDVIGYRWLVVSFEYDAAPVATKDSSCEAYFDFKDNARLNVFDGGSSLNGRYEVQGADLGLQIDGMSANGIRWAAGPNLAREQYEAIRALLPLGGRRATTTVGLSWSGLCVTMSAGGVGVTIRRAGRVPR